MRITCESWWLNNSINKYSIFWRSEKEVVWQLMEVISRNHKMWLNSRRISKINEKCKYLARSNCCNPRPTWSIPQEAPYDLPYGISLKFLTFACFNWLYNQRVNKVHCSNCFTSPHSHSTKLLCSFTHTRTKTCMLCVRDAVDVDLTYPFCLWIVNCQKPLCTQNLSSPLL